MSKFGTIARLVAVLTVVLTLSGRQSGVFAQDPAATPESDPVSEPVAEETAPPASYYVSVGCWPVGDGSQSGCSFTASSSDGSIVEALWVPSWVTCAEVVDSGGASWTGDGYHILSNSMTLTLDGSVGAAGGAGYMVRVNGNSVEAGGDGLACSPAPVVEQPDDSTGEGETPGNTTGGDTGDGNTTDSNTTDGDSSGEETTDDGSTDGGAPVAETPDEATPDTSDGNATTGEAPVVDDEGSTSETAEGGTVGDGSGASGPVATAQEVSAAEEVQAAAVVTINVIVYNCEEDPGAEDPANVCTEDETVALSATDEGADLGAPGDCGGVRCYSATVGNTFVVTETVPDGYEPIGDASETIDSVAEDATIVFVNVNEDDLGDPQLGRVQIVLGQCSSSSDKPTKYTIIEPDSIQARSVEDSCGPVAGAFLSISGGDIDGSIQGVTDEDGQWRGFLPPGDDYQVSGNFGTSPAFVVVADDITAIVIIDYSVGANGTLIVDRTVCSIGDEAGTTFTISGNEPDTSGGGCGPANGSFTIEDESGDSMDFSIGNDGVHTVTLPIGNYTITDLYSGLERDLTINEGATTYASARTISLVGRLVVRHFYCSDPSSSEADPTDGSYYRNECDEPQSTQLTLSDSGGDIDTRSGKAFFWNEIDAGSYSVSGGDGYCATINGFTDASGGFNVKPNATTRIYVYTCAAPGNGNGNGGDDDDGDDDGGNGGDDDDGGNNGDDDDDGGNNGDDDDGDDDNGNADDDDNGDNGADDDTDNGNTDNGNDDEEVASVTTLPSTGALSAGTNHNNLDELALLALALPALLAGAALARRRLN